MGELELELYFWGHADRQAGVAQLSEAAQRERERRVLSKNTYRERVHITGTYGTRVDKGFLERR